jgi:penicillin-binding protein 1A
MKVFTWDGVKDTTFSPMDSLRYYKRFLHAGFVSMDPNSGYIKTWVGGINYPFFKYDHVKQSKRQPGSLFKAYVYTAAMDAGFGPCDKLVDSPITVNYVEKGVQKSWTPKNANGSFSGSQVTLKHAFAKSINSIAVQLTQHVGWDRVIAYAHKMGVTTPLASVPSVSLGSSDVSLYELVNSYAPMVNGGYSVKPILVTKIMNKKGKVIYEAEPQKKKILNDLTAFYMLELLKSGLTEPGATTQALFEYDLFKWGTDFGGKTGTSSNQSDGWFIGVSPNLISGSWVGAESRAVHFRTTELGEGCKTALPIYGRFMEKVMKDDKFPQFRGKFPKPQGKIPKEYTCHTRYAPKASSLDSLLDNSVDFDTEDEPLEQPAE